MLDYISLINVEYYSYSYCFVMFIDLEPGYNFLTSNPVLFQLCPCSLKCQTYTTVVHKMILTVKHFNNFSSYIVNGK